MDKLRPHKSQAMHEDLHRELVAHFTRRLVGCPILLAVEIGSVMNELGLEQADVDAVFEEIDRSR